MIEVHNNVRYFFFWGGYFSNWHPSEFTIDDVTFNCGEQYMMFHKALTFEDFASAEKIMSTTSPAEQKKLGRKVIKFTEAKWDEVKYDLVKIGLREKFKQNPKLKEFLIRHKNCQIVEASPDDAIWGIGYSEYSAVKNIDNWGENLLDKILTELANELT